VQPYSEAKDAAVRGLLFEEATLLRDREREVKRSLAALGVSVDEMVSDGGSPGSATVGLDTTFHHRILQPKDQFMTASMVHVTNRVTPGSDNPSRAFGKKHQLITAGMVRVANLTPLGRECQP
jgi:hypothetical protein